MRYPGFFPGRDGLRAVPLFIGPLQGEKWDGADLSAEALAKAEAVPPM
jgi:hypothetical protein